MIRLFIEDESLKNQNIADKAEALSIFAASVAHVKPEEHMKFFDIILDQALDHGAETWEAIQKADEIYMSTALIPLVYGDYGSPGLFNNMMHKAIESGLSGKKVLIFRQYHGIQWCNLRKELVDDAFKKNFLYVLAADEKGWEQVDIDNLLRTEYGT